MARKAREAEAFGVYHVKQTSAEDKKLFENDADRIKFLEILNQSKQKFGFKLFAYCLRNPSIYHIVLHANGSDLSKIMKSINIAYAMYRKGEGKLYKDRYKSVLIEDDATYRRIKSEIEQDWVAGDCFNSDSAYCDTSAPFSVECNDCIRTVDEAKSKLYEIAKSQNTSVDALLKQKSKRNALIVDFRKSTMLSLRDIGLIFGGLTESTVCKILKKELYEDGF